MLPNNSCRRACLNSCDTPQFICLTTVTARTQDRWLCKSSYYERQFFKSQHENSLAVFWNFYKICVILLSLLFFLLFFKKAQKCFNITNISITRNQIYSKTVILNKTSPAKLTYTSSHSYIKFLIILHIQSEISKKEKVTVPTELTLKDISTTIVTWQQFAFCPEMYLIPGLIQLAELFTCTLLIHSIQTLLPISHAFNSFLHIT